MNDPPTTPPLEGSRRRRGKPLHNWIQYAISLSLKESAAYFCGAPRSEALKLKAPDIARMASASEMIAEALRAAITDGSLQEGELLRQDHIARMFNVSRI